MHLDLTTLTVLPPVAVAPPPPRPVNPTQARTYVTRRRTSASRSSASSSSARAGGGRAPKVRSDGKVDVSCPQCGTKYRIVEEDLDAKIECQECHRVFFGKTTVGKRARTQDNSKVYIGFGIGAVAIIGIFMMMSNSNDKPAPKPKVQEAPKTVYSIGNNPRTDQLVKWGQAIGSDNQLVIGRHSDMTALAKIVEVAPGDDSAVYAALKTHDSTRYLRELECVSGTLSNEEAMTAATGTGLLFVTPKPGTDDYKANTRGEIEVTFRADGEQVRVTGWTVKLPPVRNPNKPDPSKTTYIPNKDIAAPTATEITDSAGTRTVKESQPAAVPHWEKATPAQQKMADEVVADILRSADPESPGGIFTRATLRVQELDDRKAVVPRVLNAMYELYSDVNANNMKLSQLNRALVTFTGFAVNYQVESTGDAAKDKGKRESCVRQWFAFWWRYSNGDLSQFLDLREDLEEPLEDPKKKSGK